MLHLILIVLAEDFGRLELHVRRTARAVVNCEQFQTVT